MIVEHDFMAVFCSDWFALPAKITAWVRPPTGISPTGACDTRKLPLFQTTAPSLWRRAITAWPGPPTCSRIVSS